MKNLEPDPFTKSNLINKSKNVFTAVHINGTGAAIFWYGTCSLGKDVPLFGSAYYSLSDLPPVIKKHFGDLEPATIQAGPCGSYAKDGIIYKEFKELLNNAY